jgi:Lrp/AsnC family transcriptional regulator, leucine-responsive regulatory protein
MYSMLDKKDELIMTELKKDARKTTKAIAADTNIPRVTVHDRIKKMIQNGIIKGFSVSIDYKKIGYSTEVFVFISFLPNPEVSQRQLAHNIARLPGVYEVHIISGEYDLLLKVRGTSMEDIGILVVDKLRKFNGVGKTVTFASFETVKEEI